MEKIELIKAVLDKRADCLRKILSTDTIKPMDREYFQGKLDGYNQARSLLGESVASIRVEL